MTLLKKMLCHSLRHSILASASFLLEGKLLHIIEDDRKTTPAPNSPNHPAEDQTTQGLTAIPSTGRMTRLPSLGQAARANSSATTTSWCFRPSWLQKRRMKSLTCVVGCDAPHLSPMFLLMMLKLRATSFWVVSVAMERISLKVPAVALL